MKSILVLMSTYNGEKYIEQQIDSILKQQLVKVYLFIRDDGSSDKTIEIIEKYEKKYDNIKLMCGENLNWMNSFWHLVNCAKGCDYYAFSDQDDIWDDDKLIKAVNMLQKYKDIPAIYCANQRIVNDKMEIVNTTEERVNIDKFENQDFLVRGNLFRGFTEVWNNALQEYVLNLGIKDIDEPHDAFLMLICLCVGNVVKDNSDVMSYCQHGDNAMGLKTRVNSFKYIINNIMGKKRYRKPISTRIKKVNKYVYKDIKPELKPYVKQICEYDLNYYNTIRLAFTTKYPNITKKKRVQILTRRF